MPTKKTSEPKADCKLCPRLADFRKANRLAFPDFFNAPVPCFGAVDTQILIVGLAPGLRGANRTGRPFTGDYAGDLLYATLKKFNLATGEYAQDPADSLKLTKARICNAVRCVPPENKPTPAEVRACNGFLKSEIESLANLKVLIILGRIAHDATLDALGAKRSGYKFAHGAVHEVAGFNLVDSFHCSRYNTNTGKLTPAMFEDVFAKACNLTLHS